MQCHKHEGTKVQTQSFIPVSVPRGTIAMATRWFQCAIQCQLHISYGPKLCYSLVAIWPNMFSTAQIRPGSTPTRLSIFSLLISGLMPSRGGGTQLHFLCGDTPKTLFKCLCCFFSLCYSDVVVSCHIIISLGRVQTVKLLSIVS